VILVEHGTVITVDGTRRILGDGSILIDRGEILEVGPAHNPILPRRDGFRTRNVDYLDRDGLVEKYMDFKQYSPDDIEDVDYVITAGRAMADVIPDRF